MAIRLLLADDQTLLRSTFRLLLEATPDLEVVAEASTGIEAVERARSARVDVVVMDIRMPDMDGIEATRRITADEALAGVKVLVLTTFETDELVVAAVRAGASGYLSKGVEPAALIDAVRVVAAGNSLLSPVATTALISRLLTGEGDGDPEAEDPSISDAARHAVLTPREREITTLVARGMSNDEIADTFTISSATVKTHVNRAMIKTNSRDRAQLVVWAYETHLARVGAS